MSSNYSKDLIITEKTLNQVGVVPVVYVKWHLVRLLLQKDVKWKETAEEVQPKVHT